MEGGPVLKFDAKSLVRVDNSVEQRNQFGTALFSHENKIFMYGGYGFWTYKDYLTYFDFSQTNGSYINSVQKTILFQREGGNLYFIKLKIIFCSRVASSLSGNTLIDRDIKDVFIIDLFQTP